MSRVAALPVQIYHRLNADPRHWQIIALSGLFLMSWQSSDFGGGPIALMMAFSGAMLAQTTGTLWINWRKSGAVSANGFQWKSAMITALSLSILLRAANPWIWFAAGLIGIGLKFSARINDKHVFNPACIGIVIMMLVMGSGAWVSPGQWGQTTLIAGYALGFAALVLSSAKRLDIALGFLAGFAFILFARAIWLGDPMAIPMHKLQNGALLIFAFFMITDPRSTPDSRVGRILFALSVAALAAWLQIGPNQRGAPLFALASLALLTPILDRWRPAMRFQWKQEKPNLSKETENDQNIPDRARKPVRAHV